MSKKYIFLGLLLAGLLLIVAACASPTPVPTQAPAPTQPPAAPTKAPEPTAVPAPTEEPVVSPHMDEWKSSGHADVTAEAFVHWDAEKEVPTSCAKCHSSAGYQDYLGADGSEAGKVDKAVAVPPNPGVQCETCHNDKTLHMTSVTFPSGAVIENPGPSGRCMVCHQGRESTVSVNKLIADLKADDPDKTPAPVVTNGVTTTLGFRNVHYFAAAATLYGTMVKGGYEYDGKTYDAKNTHVEGYDSCAGCHDPHTLQVKVDQCAQCHEGVKTVDDLKNVRMISSAKDYDGDGDVKEGMAKEIEGLQAILYAEIQKYAKDKAGAGTVYDPATYPYFLLDADGDGQADKNDKGAVIGFSKWTPRMLKAAYNYQVSIKDPGAFAHGNKYIVQLLYDSIQDLGGDVSKLARTDAGHFAGDTMPFRDWDAADITKATAADYVVPYRCAKCHSATGLPEFISSGGTVVVDGKGTTLTAGVGPQHSANGFMCSTCHNEEKFPERYAIASVVFPSGKTVSFGGKDADGAFVADDANLCILCHQGRESTLSVNNALTGKEEDTADKTISFKNIHYLGAGATLFGADAAGAYQYDKKDYVGQNKHPLGKCTDCHDVHALEVKTEACKACHSDTKPEDIRMAATDWDGDGNTTEGVKGEIDTLAEALYAEIQKYAETKAGTPILYDGSANPYFFVDADKDGKIDKDDKGANIRYNAWTPRLLKAAFNYQYSQKDPGAFVHNPQYVVQFLIDSIGDLGGNVSGYTRPEVPKAQ
jgi:hypothetical protein